jgi:hypothetical protein
MSELGVIAGSFLKGIKEFNSCERGLARFEAQLLCNKVLEQHRTDLALFVCSVRCISSVHEHSFNPIDECELL